ncbi:hypothetical protein M3J09_013885 [Ascochyta lentis]
MRNKTGCGSRRNGGRNLMKTGLLARKW